MRSNAIRQQTSGGTSRLPAFFQVRAHDSPPPAGGGRGKSFSGEVAKTRTCRHERQYSGHRGRAVVCKACPAFLNSVFQPSAPELQRTARPSKTPRRFAIRSRLYATPPSPKRDSPTRAPGHTVFAIQYAKIGGPAPGKGPGGGRLGGRARLLKGGPPSKVFFLQGLPLPLNKAQADAGLNCPSTQIENAVTDGNGSNAAEQNHGIHLLCAAMQRCSSRFAARARLSAICQTTVQPQGKFPGAGTPGGTKFSIPYAKLGACAGEGLTEGSLEGGLP